MNALLDALVRALRDAEQFDAIAQLVGRAQIVQRDRADALDVDRLRVYAGSKRQRRENGELVGGVKAIDVERGISFRIAKALRVSQARVERNALALHTAEDVIAGAVENAVDAADLVARQPFAQRLHNRNAAGDRGLEGQRHALVFGQFGQRHAVFGQQGLVGGNDRFARGERGFHRLAGRAFVAAHQFNKQIDLA